METVTCAGCGSDRSQPVLRQRDLLFGDSTGLEEFTIVRCEGCNLLYLNPRPSSVDIGRYYPTAYFPSVSRRQKSRLEQFLKRFSRQVKQRIMEDFYGYPASSAAGSWRRLRKVVLWPEKTRRLFRGRDTLPWVGRGRLLDLGCSAGGNLAKFQDHGWDVYGIEFSEVAVAQARERFGDRIHHGTL